LKNFFEKDLSFQEVRVDRFYADICRDNQIIEIQTANFNKLRDKLEVFLPNYLVMIVYPIPHVKYMHWIDEETGEISGRRKSPKLGTPYHAFNELYKIKSYLKHPNLRLCFLLFDTDEYRLLNGWSHNRKRGSTRFDRIPTELYDLITLETPKDYLQFVPYELDVFTTADYSKCVKVARRDAVTICNILCYLEIIERIGKKGNAYLYRAVEP